MALRIHLLALGQRNIKSWSFCVGPDTLKHIPGFCQIGLLFLKSYFSAMDELCDVTYFGCLSSSLWWSGQYDLERGLSLLRRRLATHGCRLKRSRSRGNPRSKSRPPVAIRPRAVAPSAVNNMKRILSVFISWTSHTKLTTTAFPFGCRPEELCAHVTGRLRPPAPDLGVLGCSARTRPARDS